MPLTEADVRRIERALMRPVYCDDCRWQGPTGECANKGGWLSCPECLSQHIIDFYPRTLH